VILLVGGLVFLSGCVSGDSVGKLVPVSGKVTVGGAPLTSGMVSLTPDAAKGNKVKAGIVAQINADGTYQVMTNGKPGAPLGSYKVTVSAGMPPVGPVTGAAAALPSVRLLPKYMSAELTDLTIEVVEQPNPGAYDLKLAK
jgi:hypothetical protein